MYKTFWWVYGGIRDWSVMHPEIFLHCTYVGIIILVKELICSIFICSNFLLINDCTLCTFNSCNKGTSDLLEMCTWGPGGTAWGLRENISSKTRVPCYSYYVYNNFIMAKALTPMQVYPLWVHYNIMCMLYKFIKQSIVGMNQCSCDENRSCQKQPKQTFWCPCCSISWKIFY